MRVICEIVSKLLAIYSYLCLFGMDAFPASGAGRLLEGERFDNEPSTELRPGAGLTIRITPAKHLGVHSVFSAEVCF